MQYTDCTAKGVNFHHTAHTDACLMRTLLFSVTAGFETHRTFERALAVAPSDSAPTAGQIRPQAVGGARQGGRQAGIPLPLLAEGEKDQGRVVGRFLEPSRVLARGWGGLAGMD